MLQVRRCIDQAAIEEHPAAKLGSAFAIGQRRLEGAAREGCAINPWQGGAARHELSRDDPAPRLLDGRVATSRELGEQRRLAAPRTSRDDDEAIHGGLYPIRLSAGNVSISQFAV